ncbi:MAG: pitrilysin family protein [Ardenticatenia bacterium]|nr:pitrilysin family protein [Ardenticatenia bacterium]
MENKLHDVRLDNGLRVLVKEVHTAPVASFWVWYRVGSRNEVPGMTGISHWVEHMLFKGTERFPKGAIDRAIARAGGTFNAMTWMDFTAYFATLPAQQIELALEIEADRMVNSRFEPDEVEAERTVILSERHMYENYPVFLLEEHVTAVALLLHPYRHETIGWESDLRTMTRDDLYRHYRTYYTPNNATAVAVGDIDGEAMIDRIARAFGSIDPGPEIPPVRFQEPPQRGERRVAVSGPGSTRYLHVAYRAPAATDADWPALAVLDTILGGAKGYRGASPNSRTSRLYRALVDGGLAAGVSTSLVPTVDPYLYTVTVTLLPDSDPQQVEEVLFREVDRLRQEAITARELEKAKKQMRAQFAFSTESISSQAYWLGFSSIIADVDWFTGYLGRLHGVSADDVQRVAREYLDATRRTVGWYEPDSSAAGAVKSEE